MIDWNTVPINESSVSLYFTVFFLGIFSGSIATWIILKEKSIYERWKKK